MAAEDRSLGPGTRRIYAEMLPWEELVRPRVLQLLRSYRLELVLAVRPWDVDALGATLGALARAEVPVALWPMTANEHGRWASVETATVYAGFAGRVLEAARRSGAPVRDLLVDLEPPIARVRAVVESPRAAEVVRSARALVRAAHVAEVQGVAALSALVARAHDAGLTVSAAAMPPLVFGRGASANAWERLLGTPCAPLGLEHVSVMAYTTILSGWSRGLVRRADAVALLAELGRRVRTRGAHLGFVPGLSLGAVGTGALVDEPTYDSPRDLAVDADVARRTGVDSLALFELAGVLARPPAEAWLAAFVHGTAALPPAPRAGAPVSERHDSVAVEGGTMRAWCTAAVADVTTRALQWIVPA